MPKLAGRQQVFGTHRVAVVQGAPILIFDVAVFHQRNEENVDRLIACLTSLGARYRNRPDPPLPPNRSALLGPGHSLFMTDLGPLDAVGAIEGGADYDQLLPDPLATSIGGRTVHASTLEKIVALKWASSDPKDKLLLPFLEAVLQRRSPAR